MKTIYFTLLAILFTTYQSEATHNRAGEITIRQIDDLTIEVSLTTYTKPSSSSVDRDTLPINWGDGNIENIPRTNGPNNDGEFLANDIKKNIYQKTHTYATMGTFLISMTDPNRNQGILNLNPPNSDNVPFHIQTSFTLVDMNPGDVNTTPILLEAPIDIAFTGQPFVHVPNGFDIDGDSLSYELALPLFDIDMIVPNYFSPTEINPGQNNQIYLNPETGVFTWASPQLAGEYVITFLIKSYRNGQETDRIIRDMQITVKDLPEAAPNIVFLGAQEDVVIPVSLGDTVRVSFDISEPDVDQDLFISSSCGLYDFYNSNATFDAVVNGNTGTAVFEWIVKEEHLRQYSYQLVVQAVGSESSEALSSFAVFRFRTADFVSGNKEILTSVNNNLYPNPANDLLFLETDLAYPLDYILLDSRGSLLRKGVFRTEDQAVNVEGLANGSYYLQLIGGDGRQTGLPFIIAR